MSSIIHKLSDELPNNGEAVLIKTEYGYAVTVYAQHKFNVYDARYPYPVSTTSFFAEDSIEYWIRLNELINLAEDADKELADIEANCPTADEIANAYNSNVDALWCDIGD